MIYYKKRSFLSRIKNKLEIAHTKDINKKDFLLFLKRFFLAVVLFISFLYISYLFVAPNVIKEDNIENIVNYYLSKNSKLKINIDDIKINPDFKFEICISAKQINLIHNNKNNAIVAINPKIKLNLLTLFFKYIDLNDCKTDKIIINTNFTKKQKYSLLEQIPADILDLEKHNSGFKIRNMKISSDNAVINIYDENIKKQFKITSNKIKFEKRNCKVNNVLFSATGAIYAQNKKLNDFIVNISYKYKNKQIQKIITTVEKLNYNPFIYADKYDFYSKSNINLKINALDKTPITGQIALNELNFKIKNIQIPKNNLFIVIKNNKIQSNFDFKLIKDQFIKVNSTINISKNKYIELSLNSNEIDLNDFHEIISSISKIFNLGFNFSNVELKGLLNVDMFIKSDFKTINSKGSFKIKNANLKHKILNLSLDNINSTVDLKNNNINIINTSAYFENSKFNIKGIIDNKTNLDIKINSDAIDFAKLSKLIFNLPILSKFNLTDYVIKKGYLKINTNIKGTVNKPIFNSSSTLDNFIIFINSLKANLSVANIKIIPNIINGKFQDAMLEADNILFSKEKLILKSQKINLKIKENDIELLNSNVSLNAINAKIQGLIHNYRTKQPDINIALEADINKKNNFIIIQNFDNAKAKLNILIKKNSIIINNAQILNNNKTIAYIQGEIINFKEKIPTLNKIKIITQDKISVISPLFDNVSAVFSSDIEINGKINIPKVNGKIDLYNFEYPKLDLIFQNAILNLNNSNCYINIINGKILNFNFDLVAQAKYLNNKIIIDYADISSNYIDFNKIEKYLNDKKITAENIIEISNIKGKILSLNFADFNLNNLSFEGNYRNNILDINKFDAQIFNGKIEGKLTTDLLTQNTKTMLILKDINLRLVKGALKELSIAVSGKLSSFINAQFFGYDYDNILKTLDGYIKFNIDDGELAQFAKLERFLQAGNILSQSILKLTLNSTLSTVTKQNTGYFKTIEGTIKIKNTIAYIQYLKSIGENMSLYMEGNFNILNQICRMTILGRIPLSIVNVLGDVGSFKTEALVDKLSADTRQIVKSVTSSPIEKMLTIKVIPSDLEKIPPLYNMTNNLYTREFLVKINGKTDTVSSIKIFRWVLKED